MAGHPQERDSTVTEKGTGGEVWGRSSGDEWISSSSTSRGRIRPRVCAQPISDVPVSVHGGL